jgi:hypothetical protein
VKKQQCKTCGVELEVKGKYHAGFSDLGFLYCDKDTTVLTFSSYDPQYQEIVGRIHPWVLAWDGKMGELRRVESRLRKCPCGGSFSFLNPLRCPVCRGAFSGPISDDIYFVILGKRIDGEKTNIWKDREVVEEVSRTD